MTWKKTSLIIEFQSLIRRIYMFPFQILWFLSCWGTKHLLWIQLIWAVSSFVRACPERSAGMTETSFLRKYFHLDFYFFIFLLMNSTEIILHADGFENEREFLENETRKWISGKLDSYLKKYTKEGDKTRVEVWFTRGKKWFSGKIHLVVSGRAFHTERENFEKLEDLVSHLFTHLKDQMA